MEPEQIKLEIERCLVKTLSCFPENPLDWKLHPVRVVQAAKSIVGMDLESPSKRLMDWLVNYCESVDQQQMQMPEKKQVGQVKRYMHHYETTKQVVGVLIKFTDEQHSIREFPFSRHLKNHM